jgi:hypothetical protein
MPSSGVSVGPIHPPGTQFLRYGSEANRVQARDGRTNSAPASNQEEHLHVARARDRPRRR